MRKFFGAGVQQQIFVLPVAPDIPSLEQILHGDRNFAELSAEHFLQLLGEQRIRPFGFRLILQLLHVIEHVNLTPVKLGVYPRHSMLRPGKCAAGM